MLITFIFYCLETFNRLSCILSSRFVCYPWIICSEESMRNVSLSSISQCKLAIEGSDVIGVEEVKGGKEGEYVFIATNQTLCYVSFGNIIRETKWLEEGEEKGRIVSFNLIQGGSQAVAVFEDGRISVVEIEGTTIHSGTVHSIGLPGKIISSVWHPSHTLLCIVTEDLQLIILDSLFDVIAMSDLETENGGLDELVTVGWGSEKTQFQGSVGKNAREKKVVESREVDGDDDMRTRMEWRTDGEVLVVNYYHPLSNERRCSTWNSEGQLLSRVLKEDPIQEAVTIRPVGNVMAIGSKGGLIMAERNGEKRNGMVDVQSILAGGRITNASWNMDGSILAVEVIKGDSHYLQLWLCTNYEWVCKRSLPFPQSIIFWRWDTEEMDRLLFVSLSQTGQTLLTFLQISLVGTAVDTIALSVGNNCIRVTDFSRVVIPPPMSEVSLPLPSPPTAIALSPSSLAVIDHSFTLHLWRRNDGRCLSFSSSPPVSLSLPQFSIITSLSVNEKEVRIAFLSENGNEVETVNWEGKQMRREECASPLLWMGYNKNKEVQVNELSLNDVKITQSDIITLSKSGTLHCNSSPMASSVTSFSIHSSFLAWIDSQFILHVRDTVTGDSCPPRRVEKGSRLVVIAPPKIVMQMPRGNIETIHSRFFLERSIRSMLDEGRIVDSLVEMKRHRVPMTLVHDHAPHLLLNPSSWISSIQDSDLLNLLISQLRNTSDLSSICDSLSLSILSLSINDRRRLFPSLIFALLTKTPPEITLTFKNLLDNLPSDSSRSSLLREWLHICSFFLNSISIFHASLSTYNLPFVVEVIESLSIDPNEYMETLNELHAISDDSFRCFRIDCLREDWVGALRHLARDVNRLDEAKKLVVEKNLYSWAVEIYGESEQLNEMAELCGREHERKGEWREAAIMKRLAGDEEGELKMREKSGQMHEWIEVLSRLKWSQEKKNETFNALEEKLQRDSKWKELAILLCITCALWKKRLSACEKAGEWKRIVQIGEKEGKEAEEEARKILRERSEQIEKTLTQILNQLDKFASRLHVIREIKKDKISKLIQGEMLFGDLENADAFSESSLLSSRSSRSRSSRTSAMSRKTKKIEKKKSSLKEGGEWEDAAILIASHEQWRTMRRIMVESSSLLPSLVSLRLFSTARSLSNHLNLLEKELNVLSVKIWPPRLESFHLTGPLTSIYDVEGMVVPPSVDSSFPPSMSLDTEMCPPLPLNDEEKKWRTSFF